jgi:hypothetical protein
MSLFSASYTLLTTPPSDLRAGEALILDLELRNSGQSPWLTAGSYPVRLGYRWLDAAGQPLAAEGRALLPAPVPPGLSARVELRVESPREPGRYRLQVELLEEGQAWFSQRGVAPLSLELEFRPATAPRVAILNGNIVAHDAVGSHVLAQLLALREAGYHTLLITGFVDSRLPLDARRSMAPATTRTSS